MMGRDGYTGLAVMAVSLVLLWATLGLERNPMVPVGPAFYPRIVLGVTGLLALILLVTDVLAHRRARAPAAPAAGGVNYALVVLAFAVFAAYVVALPYLGFRAATFAFLAAMPPLLERPRTARGWAGVLALAIAGTAVTYLVFESYLQVLLPRGRWTGF